MQRLFLQLLRNYPDGLISIIDRDFRFVYTGGELHERLLADPEELLGREMYPRFPGELRSVIRGELENVFSGASISGFDLPGQLAGSYYTMDAFPLREEDNSIRLAGIIIRNVSAVRQAEIDLKNTLARERELGELKSKFVTMASHEFRTPLSAILSSAYLLDKYTGADDQPKRKKHVEKIISSVNLLTEILNDFLSLGKIEEGRLLLKPVPVNISQLLNAQINEIRPILKKKQQLNYSHTGNGDALLDKQLVVHIVMNLLSNAIKFSGEDGQIEIHTRHNGNDFFLSVKDNGIGISEKDQKHLFGRFFRGENAANIQGTGLGLHIVSRYVELMNGKVICHSRLDAGTEFIVEFKTEELQGQAE